MICAGSDSLHAEMIYAKSLATAMFTFGDAGLEVSKAKQKGRQTPVSETCCGTWSFFFFLSFFCDTSSASSAPALFLLASKSWWFRLMDFKDAERRLKKEENTKKNPNKYLVK